MTFQTASNFDYPLSAGSHFLLLCISTSKLKFIGPLSSCGIRFHREVASIACNCEIIVFCFGLWLRIVGSRSLLRFTSSCNLVTIIFGIMATIILC